MALLDKLVSPRDLFTLQRMVSTNFVLAAGQSTQLAKENPDRIAVLFVPTNNTSFFIAPYSISTTVNAWAVANNTPFVLTYDQHYKMCQVEWYATPSGMSANALMIEVILDRTHADYGQQNRGRGNAPVSARGAPSNRFNRQLADWVESVTGRADNLSAVDQSLYALIRRRGGRP